MLQLDKKTVTINVSMKQGRASVRKETWEKSKCKSAFEQRASKERHRVKVEIDF